MFVIIATSITMNAEQKAEADIMLVMITGELKRIDAAIQNTLFGGHAVQSEARPLLSLAREEIKADFHVLEEAIKRKDEKIKKLVTQNQNLRSQLFLYKHVKSKGKVHEIYTEDIS